MKPNPQKQEALHDEIVDILLTKGYNMLSENKTEGDIKIILPKAVISISTKGKVNIAGKNRTEEYQDLEVDLEHLLTNKK